MTTPTQGSDMHPKALEAQQAAAERAEKRNHMKEVIRTAKQGKIRFLHIRRTTIAYVIDTSNVIILATTIRNPSDTNDPLLGKYYAFKRLRMGYAIMLHMENGWSPSNFLINTFRFCK